MLFGLEESAERHFLVMELVEGETLADRIARAQLNGSRRRIKVRLTFHTTTSEARERSSG
ncbi:MAG: hypothetical protein AUI64_02585 [Acidobacteria bacterium 13_1_40CM_2_64_6]|nr:MAG: hypothetical protein AUJ01_10705 [Acidobacteria bacterium 13_1_40CM_3_65_5]OLD56136.1 MAG: hypothetical protein AUI64_02585 [Acidobacteria bacterium 13_1_40CM_2_64_6]OLE82019.1 MAG: hypothetical protein AUF76_11155 [Acidobacteria bacterium 13_1_20CM_2_65_9]